MRDLCALIIHCHTAADVVCLMVALSAALADGEQKRTELAASQINNLRSTVDKNDEQNRKKGDGVGNVEETQSTE